MIEDLKKIASIVVPYSLLCAFLNLYYFWKPFGIQPFEFISFSEAFAYAVPFLMVSLFALAPVFLIELIKPSDYIHPTEPEAAQSYVGTVITVTVVLNLVAIFLAESKFNLGLIVFSGIVSGITPGAINLSDSSALKVLIQSRLARIFLCLVLCCLPAASALYAISSRSAIIERTDYQYITGSDIVGSSEKTNLIYIGHLGDYIFFIRENEKLTVAYRMSDLKKLELRPFAKERK